MLNSSMTHMGLNNSVQGLFDTHQRIVKKVIIYMSLGTLTYH